MSKKRTNGMIVKVLSFILLLALIGGGIALIYRYTNGFNEDFKTFYLEYNGGKILQETSEMGFVSGSEATFDVKYTFDFGDEAREYNVKVLPNEEEVFEYTVGERYVQWRAKDETADLSSLFGLKKDETSFTLTFPSDMTAETALKSLYAGQEVTVDADALKGKKIFRLEVSSYNEKITYVINFSVGVITVTLDRESIIFGGA